MQLTRDIHLVGSGASGLGLTERFDCHVYAVDAMLPGHHEFSLRDGQRHIDTANRLFQRGFVPRSVV